MVLDEVVRKVMWAERVIRYGLTISGFETPFHFLGVLGTNGRLSLWVSLSLSVGFVCVDRLPLCGQTSSCG